MKVSNIIAHFWVEHKKREAKLKPVLHWIIKFLSVIYIKCMQEKKIIKGREVKGPCGESSGMQTNSVWTVG